MGFFLGTCVMHNIFLCRHKSSNRVQPIYQTSPEQYQEQKEDYIFIYFYIEASLLFLPARLLYMCDPAILLFHCRLSANCVNLIISKDLQLSLRQNSLAAMASVHFLLFYVSPQREWNDQMCPFKQELICCSVTFCCCANFSTNLTCVCILMYKQITTGWHLTENCCNLLKQNWNQGLPDVCISNHLINSLQFVSFSYFVTKYWMAAG